MNKIQEALLTFNMHYNMLNVIVHKNPPDFTPGGKEKKEIVPVRRIKHYFTNIIKRIMAASPISTPICLRLVFVISF